MNLNIQRYKECNSITIYLGGYHNEVRREMLKKLYNACKHIRFYHWGDIDCGGFRIFNHLVEKTEISFFPMNMDIKILEEYINYTKPLTAQDIAILTSMQEDERYKCFWRAIEFMLRNKIKLGQEIISC